MTNEELQAQVNALQAQLAAAPKGRKLTIGFGNKRNVKVTLPGQRYPVTLYKSDMRALCQNADKILAFITANDSLLDDKE